MNYAQDFMAGNKGLNQIYTHLYGPYDCGYRDTTFKLSRLKSGWNTYFTELTTISINEDHWNHEDLSSLTKLKYFSIMATTQDHTDNTSSPIVPITSNVMDNIVNQIAAGAGTAGVKNGTISFNSGGTTLTSASTTAFNQLKAAGWTIYLNGVVQ
jgi:hypothetical protein